MKTILNIARKQMLSVICAIVALVAIVLSFWPTGSWYSDLESNVDQRYGMYTRINNILTATRQLPSLSLDTNTPATLTEFPTQDIIDVAVQAVDQVHGLSMNLLTKADNYNRHVPLLPGVLNDGGDILRTNFGTTYLQALNDDARIRAWPTPDVVRARTGPPIPELHAGRRVSDDEVKKALEQLKEDINRQYEVPSVLSDGKFTAESIAQAAAVYEEKSRRKPLELQLQAASQCKVYLETGALKRPDVYSKFVSATNAPPLTDIWSAQLALWIDEDVATGVAYANEHAAAVKDSAVKQILDVTLKTPPYVVSGDPTLGKDDGILPKAFDVSPSGRVCNGMYDVVQYTVRLDVDANRVPAVLQSLQRNQLITVLNVQAKAIDTSEPALDHFIYGNQPIVRLDLQCEELFLHDWSSSLQPAKAGPSVAMGKADLGGPQ